MLKHPKAWLILKRRINMKIIALTQGMETIVDSEYFEWLNQWKWHLGSGGYARRTIHLGRGKGKQDPKGIWMHRELMKPEQGFFVDHINGNRLDNRKSNLRIVSNLQNCWNKRILNKNTSGYKGVSWKKDKMKFKAYITVNTKQVHLGYFNCPLEAAKAYDEAALKYFGEYARINHV